jgi:hypothetical protein
VIELAVIALVIAVVTLDLALVAYRRWFAPNKRKQLRRQLGKIEPIAIAALPQRELARIVGIVAAREALLPSRLGREPCIGYGIAIETRYQDGNWQTVLTTADCESFVVTDDSETVVVEPPLVIALDPYDGAWTNLPEGVLNTPAHKLLQEVGWSPGPLDGEMRCQEVVLRPGDRVSVVGRATLEIDPGGRGSFRSPPMLNHIRGSDEEPVVVAHEAMQFA